MSSGLVKKGLTAFLLSIVTPGLGQVYNGQLWEGVFSFAGLLGFLTLSAAVGLVHSFKGLVVHVVLFLAAYLFVIGQSCLTAIRQVRADRRPVQTWRSYVLGISLFSINLLFLSGNTIPDGIPGVRAYKVTVASMAPTVVPGDRIIADMQYYRSHPPRRGDVIIFRVPTNSEVWMKRIVAVGGDVISLSGQKVQVNGTVVSEPYTRYEPVEGSVESGDFKALTIPADRFFVMGDNRNHSFDSRYFGPIGRDRILGKPLYVYWSQEKSRIGRDIR